MEDGKDYIVENRYNKDIDLNKAYLVNNEVDLSKFKFNCGTALSSFSLKAIAQEITRIFELPKEELTLQGENAKILYVKYDFAKLTE